MQGVWTSLVPWSHLVAEVTVPFPVFTSAASVLELAVLAFGLAELAFALEALALAAAAQCLSEDFTAHLGGHLHLHC